MIFAGLAVVVAIQVYNLFLAGVKTQLRQVYRVGTHVCDTSALVQVLGYHHGLTNRVAKFAGGLLLQCRCGERGSGHALHWFLGDGLDSKLGCLALLQKLHYLIFSLETAVECGLDL